MFNSLIVFLYIHATTLASLIPFFSADTTSPPDWISYLLNGGPFAVVVLLVVLDKLTNTGERDRLRLENEVLRKEIKDLNQSIRNEIVPPLVQLNALMKDVIAELSDRRYISPTDDRGRR